jgi:hypothetical protein
MKKIIFITLISVLSLNASAQLMSLGFVKNCMTYDRTALTNELFKKHYEVAERAVATAQNPMLAGATSYSNEKTPANGEIKVLSLINDTKKITEIYFVNGPKNNYDKNFTEVYNQMVSFFNNESSFKSKKYNVDVTKFTKDKIFYYVYKIKEMPVIVVANYKIEELYFN